MNRFFQQLVTSVVLSLMMSCANISTPTGGKRDSIPPVLLSTTPADSLRNSIITKIKLDFDEYITLGDASKEVEIWPMLQVPPTVTSANKHVIIKLPDTLLQPNTTYRLSLGKAVRDLHEGNIFSNYTYTFSTGNYFDSATTGGTVANAETGEKDTVNVIIVLYNNEDSDSAVVRKKPLYRVKPDNNGRYVFKGLPVKPFRMYAIKDDNGNMMYDGGSEMIAFCNDNILPSDTVTVPIELRLFREATDSTDNAGTGPPKKTGKVNMRIDEEVDTVIRYTLNVDTTNITKRTFDINDSLQFVFSKDVTINHALATLKHDSAGTEKIVGITVSAKKDKQHVFVKANWHKNTVYTMVLESGFASDTAGIKSAASTIRFRTFNNDDYGKITVMIPDKYVPAKPDSGYRYLLAILADGKPAGQLSIKNNSIAMPQLKPATYTFRIIVDENRNETWDTGDLMGRRQPEKVIPGTANVILKAGWEHTVDFETKPDNDKKKKK